MSAPHATDQQCIEVREAVQRCGSQVKAALELGVSRATVQVRLAEFFKRGLDGAPEVSDKQRHFEAPDLPASELPFEDELPKLVDAFKRRHAAHRAKAWMPFRLKIDGPFGLAFVGDPHLDDDGTNYPLLLRDVDLLRETEGLFGVGMGDWLNSWAGRLQKLYADQSMTRSRAWQAAAWLLGQPFWMLLLKGNHDMWNGSADPLDWLSRGSAPMEEWQARFKVVSPNGRHFKIHAAHSFPGNSMWNPNHGGMRAAKMSGAEADVYVQGHHHEWAMFQQEAGNGRVFWALKARGYKFIDHYADQLGYLPQQHGATVTAIMDPDAAGPAAVQCYGDLAEAAEYLEWRRAKWAQGKRAAA